ncbi:cadherin-related family member 4-like [Hemitrygon akajei]|uniref:cadherin-related family member 4-like n=1 Tax=Hemitrygon akajei TaxID=2704970 RepID=UPI003BF962D7
MRVHNRLRCISPNQARRKVEVDKDESGGWNVSGAWLPGRLKVSNLLAAETVARYSLTVQAVDLNNDAESDPQKQKTSFTTVTVNVTNLNDEPPVCNPAYYEATIYSTIKTLFLQHCSGKDSPNDQLGYLNVASNKCNHFVLQRTDMNLPTLAMTQSFQFDILTGERDPGDCQLLVEVTDEFGGISGRQLTTTATVVIHVIPWRTTQPTTSMLSTPVLPFNINQQYSPFQEVADCISAFYQINIYFGLNLEIVSKELLLIPNSL